MKRYDQINSFHLHEIERQVGLLKIAITSATLSLTPFRDHYDALIELDVALRRALNLLNDRPADYVKPHGQPRA